MFDDTLLVKLGFTELESKLYCEMLRSGSGTGYGLAKRLGKAAPNIYQSLRSLEAKGAAVCSEGLGEATTYGATPPDQLLEAMRRRHAGIYDVVRSELEQIERRIPEERVFAISTVDILFERVRSMLASATDIILFDFFPVLYDLLRDEIDAARARGVVVAGIAYETRHAEAYMPLNPASLDLVAKRWPGLGLLLVIDGREQLIALISDDLTRVLKAIWSDSVFLSCVFHSAIAADIRLVALRADPSDPLRDLTLQASAPPGLHMLLELGRT